MNGLRLKVTPTVDSEGMIHVLMETVEVVDNQIVRTVAREEWRTTLDRLGCSYVSKVVFTEGHELPGAFWVDEQGRRHFHIGADAGEIRSLGEPIGSN